MSRLSRNHLPHMDDTDRAKRLAAVMENRGWTQEAVETLTGIPQPTLSRWFSSETVRMSQRNRRAVDDLLANTANTADADRARRAAAKLLAADELEKAAKAAADRLRAEATSNGAGAVAAADAVKEEKKERPRRLGVDE